MFGLRYRDLPSSYQTLALILRPFLMSMTKRDWQGQEHLPRSGGFVAAPNHVSHFDPLATAHFLYDNGHPPFYLGKEEVFEMPVVGRLITGSGQIPVYRGTGQATTAYRAAVAGVLEGKAVVVYPEGTLTRDPQLWPMTGKTGAARIALETRRPVVPIAQWGAQEIVGTYTAEFKLLPRKTMHVRAGPPVVLDDLYGRPLDAETLAIGTARIMAAITAELAVLRGEEPPAQPFDAREHGLPETGDPRRRPTA